MYRDPPPFPKDKCRNTYEWGVEDDDHCFPLHTFPHVLGVCVFFRFDPVQFAATKTNCLNTLCDTIQEKDSESVCDGEREREREREREKKEEGEGRAKTETEPVCTDAAKYYEQCFAINFPSPSVWSTVFFTCTSNDWGVLRWLFFLK